MGFHGFSCGICCHFMVFLWAIHLSTCLSIWLPFLGVRWGRCINLKPSFSGAVFSKPRLKPPALQRLNPPVNNGQNLVNCHLVGGIPTPLKNDEVKVSWGYDIPNMMGKIIQMFQTTNQSYVGWKLWILVNKNTIDNGGKPSKTIIFMEIHGLVPLINTRNETAIRMFCL